MLEKQGKDAHRYMNALSVISGLFFFFLKFSFSFVCTRTHAHTVALFVLRVLFRNVHVCCVDNTGVCDL